MGDVIRSLLPVTSPAKAAATKPKYATAILPSILKKVEGVMDVNASISLRKLI